jgi:uncharacterized RDD family membrane protein YckC
MAEPAAVRNVGATPAPEPTPQAPTATAASAESATRGRKICPGCHRFNAAASAFCADCGVALPATSTVPLFGGPAGFWIRLVAFIIDAILLALVQALLADRLGISAGNIDHLPWQEGLLRILPELVFGSAVTAVYAMIMVGTWGGTLGKLILGLRVVRHSDGGKVPYGLALGRSLAEFMSLIPIGLGYVWIALSPSKRGWHDYLCDTRVVYAKAR